MHDESEPIWRQCERIWAAWLADRGWTVTPLTSSTENVAYTNAPMAQLPGRHGAAINPDLLAVRAGRSRYWDVKSRRISQFEQATGRATHSMNLANFNDYLRLQEHTGYDVYIALFEYPSALSDGRWLTISVTTIKNCGRITERRDEDTTKHRLIEWPVAQMDVVHGPSFPSSTSITAYQPFVPHKTAQRIRTTAQDVTVTPLTAATHTSTQHDAFLAVVEALALPAIPRYSVLSVNPPDPVALLGLLEYGIRVFLITPARVEAIEHDRRLQAFREARLLESACVPSLAPHHVHMHIDGHEVAPDPRWFHRLLHDADVVGTINIPQYRIVHAPFDADILVTAGAGTGKTETMAERFVFLLCVAHLSDSKGKPISLSLADFSLITFTRDAAREMRSRIARTILMRQRLCTTCILPTIAWLMQLGKARITTIHAFAKQIIQQRSGIIDVQPDFRVATDIFTRRAYIRNELSERLEPLYQSESAATPPLHLWIKHIESVWDALENNGVPFMTIHANDMQDSGQQDADGNRYQLTWMDEYLPPADERIAVLTQDVIRSAAKSYAAHCAEQGTIPTNQLVPSAITILNEIHQNPDILTKELRDPIRFLFIDEFQDTDALQMELILALRTHYSTQLFMVGDAKQGIYRFRGAQGNSFDMLKAHMRERDLPEPALYPMTRNFRSDGLLLTSLHPLFAAWGERNLLPYAKDDRLLPRWDVQQHGTAIDIQTLMYGEDATTKAVDLALHWRATNPDASIAILTRHNYAAIDLQQAIRSRGGQCDVLVGGSFFQSPAVLELRVLLEAMIFSEDDAALLELCDTRWAGMLFAATDTPAIVSEDREAWTKPLLPFVDWQTRLQSLTQNGNLYRDDLDQLRARVRSLASLLRTLPTIAFIVACRAALLPDSCRLDTPYDDSERARYERGLTHLLTILDETFAENPITPIGLLHWLNNQMATNHREDEPQDDTPNAGRTIALTVHKSKGLEFDCVLIPSTKTSFDHIHDEGTESAVIEHNGRRRILWRWIRKDKTENQNTSSQDTTAWDTNTEEVRQEETRLLYVALTRAKHLLTVFKGTNPIPHSWGALLDMRSADAD